MPMRLAAVLVCLLAAGCGAGGPSADASPCEPIATQVPIEPTAAHVEAGTVIDWATNPPASGDHYGQWARWNRVYDPPMPRGHWLHNLEHGGVVFLYNCPDGCPELVDDLTGITATLPADPACPPDIAGRWLISSDPLLPPDVPVAAVAWGWIYTAMCLDEHTLRKFYADRVGRGREQSCGQGQIPPPGPDAGLADAGEPDGG